MPEKQKIQLGVRLSGKIQDGGGRHLEKSDEKSENSHISAAVRPILTKFGTVTHNSE